MASFHLRALLGTAGVLAGSLAGAAAQRISPDLPLSFEVSEAPSGRTAALLTRAEGRIIRIRPTAIEISSIRGEPPVVIEFLHARDSAKLQPLDPLPGKVNYLFGPDPSRWRTNIPTWRRGRFHDVYRGIDAVYYGDRQNLEFDLNLRPGAAASAISFRIRGAAASLSSSGDLVIASRAGRTVLHVPKVYQPTRGAVPASYQPDGRSQFTIRIGAYDHAQPLVIDPVITYSGTFGSSTTVTGMASDTAGNGYIAGYFGPGNTKTIPLTPGAYDATTTYPDTGFVTKLNAGGDVILYSTYVGITPTAIAVDSTGQVYVTGGGSPNLLKLNAAGTALTYSAHMPGSPQAIAVDSSGAAYLTGSVGENPIPVTPGAAQTKPTSAFVEKLDPTGSTLVYATYLGGTATDQPNAIAVDANGNAYITGTAQSSDFPIVNAYQNQPGAPPLVRTADAGATFTSISLGLPSTPWFLAAVPGNPSAMYAGVQTANGRQLFATSNAGAAWMPRGTLPSGYSSTAPSATIVPDPKNSSTLYYLASDVSNLYKSSDSGATWQTLTITNAPQVTQLLIDPQNTSTLYAVAAPPATGSGSTAALFKSGDGGATWVQLNFGISGLGAGVFGAALVVSSNLTIIYALAGPYLLQCSDGGVHWGSLGEGPQSGQTRLMIAAANPTIMYSASSNTSSVSRDGGATWQILSTPPILFVDPADATIVYYLSSGTLFQAKLSGAAVAGTKSIQAGVSAAAFDSGQPASLYLAVSTSRDAFVAKLNAAGSQWLYSTYFGGSGIDVATAIAVDAQGSAYIAGTTNSTNLPVTAGVVQKALASTTGSWQLGIANIVTPTGDVFLARFDPSGSKLQACTYLGGSARDSAAGIAVDAAGNVYVAGTTDSSDFPITPDSPSTPPVSIGYFPGSFLAQLNNNFTQLAYSGYFNQTLFASIAANSKGDILIAGSNSSVFFADVHFGPPSSLPQIATAGIVDVFSSQTDRSVPGSIESVYGTNLAASSAGAAGTPLPLSLAGTSVTIDGVPAPLFYASPNQLNVQVPYEIKPGLSQMIVTTPTGASLPAAMTVNAASPNILVNLNTNHAIALNQDGTYNSPDNPAPVASTITLFLTGQGAVSGAPATGAAASGPAPATLPASAKIGKATASIAYLGLTPGSVGLAQANIVIPQVTPSDYPLIITINGVASNWSIVSIGGGKQ